MSRIGPDKKQALIESGWRRYNGQLARSTQSRVHLDIATTHNNDGARRLRRFTVHPPYGEEFPIGLADGEAA